LLKELEGQVIQTAVIAGAGNVAWHLGNHLFKSGISILQVFNRSVHAGQELAQCLKAPFTNKTEEVIKNADLYLLAVSDDALEVVSEQFRFPGEYIVLHTAGAVSMQIFEGKAENYGVLYPLQTLSRNKPVDFNTIPLLIEANSSKNLEIIRQLACRLSECVYEMNSENRMFLHLAAVIGSNFTNHLLSMSERIMTDRGLPFNLLRPLILETVEKAFSITPQQAQTGPAVRGNKRVIQRHMALLESYPQIRELYSLLSESIFNMADNKRGLPK
jgi:predicted short-subunit dehydrogenase-like oxidoreductase (DUF2520 family)